MPPASTILQHDGLFGESRHLPDVIHCETIAARAPLHDWELAPHRHARLHQVLLLTHGGGSAKVEGQAWPLQAMTLVNVAPGDVHTFRFDPHTEGFVVSLADEMLEPLLAGVGTARSRLTQSFACTAGTEVLALMQQLWTEFNALHSARALVLRGLSTTLLGWVARLAEPLAQAATAAERPPLLRRFENLVEEHFRAHWGVADYARALSISPTHLSRLVRADCGRSASALIDERVVREARRSLAYTNLHIATIAYGLGFADPAHFSRFFTRASGLSPRQFRRQVLG